MTATSIKKGETKTATLAGKLRHDRHHWSDHVMIDGEYVRYWIFDRLGELPGGSLVSITIEARRGEAE